MQQTFCIDNISTSEVQTRETAFDGYCRRRAGVNGATTLPAEERMRPGHWLASVSALICSIAWKLMVGWKEGHAVRKESVPLIPGGFLPEQEEEEDPRGKWLTQVHLEKRPLNVSSSSSSNSSIVRLSYLTCN